MGDLAGPSGGPLDPLNVSPNFGESLIGGTHDPQLATGKAVAERNAVATTATPLTSNRRRRSVCSYCGNAFRREEGPGYPYAPSHRRATVQVRSLSEGLHLEVSASVTRTWKAFESDCSQDSAGPQRLATCRKVRARLARPRRRKIGVTICSKLFRTRLL
ncbi:hypothetical protein HPB48_020491 [Haemaphysalis longicornis]|uniref:Uncharacterized protein n=1 Tax=Haemaphysalis longicornis TaxID=44386 RepID=A0A9J6G8B3_HAELO|nr:hypothetical protein HPB48_020491 [Haemaphysalis longicornis]